MKEISLSDFELRLKAHNWNYKDEQCSSVWNDGHIEYKRLIEIAGQSLKHRNMLDYYKGLNEVKR